MLFLYHVHTLSMYLPLLDVFQKHVYDVTKEVRMKLIATHFMCCLCVEWEDEGTGATDGNIATW